MDAISITTTIAQPKLYFGQTTVKTKTKTTARRNEEKRHPCVRRTVGRTARVSTVPIFVFELPTGCVRVNASVLQTNEFPVIHLVSNCIFISVSFIHRQRLILPKLFPGDAVWILLVPYYAAAISSELRNHMHDCSFFVIAQCQKQPTLY